MILNHLQTVEGKYINIRIDGGKITAIQTEPFKADEEQITFDDALVLPGLINSHDHLEFNLYPQLGYRTYDNYTQWGPYIHQKYKTEIGEIERVPKSLRTQWGAYKNLLCGVTTVVNHGEYFNASELPVYVHQQVHNLHSPGFEKEWKLKLNNPLKRGLPVVIHTGEGTDDAAREETGELLKWNLLKRMLIGIHGVAMTPEQAEGFEALVWCPQSNFFLLNKTAPINKLKKHTQILFGTDSTLTGEWDIWQHIDIARITGFLTDVELYQSLFTTPAAVWGLNKGRIEIGVDADLIVVKNQDNDNALSTALSSSPENILMVIRDGQIQVLDTELVNRLQNYPDLQNFSLIKIGNTFKYVRGRLDLLISEIKRWLPNAELPVETAAEIIEQAP